MSNVKLWKAGSPPVFSTQNDLVKEFNKKFQNYNFQYSSVNDSVAVFDPKEDSLWYWDENRNGLIVLSHARVYSSTDAIKLVQKTTVPQKLYQIDGRDAQYIYDH